jgi:hypothetical protein
MSALFGYDDLSIDEALLTNHKLHQVSLIG